MLYAFEPAATGPTFKKRWSLDLDPGAPKTDIHSYLGNRQTSPSVVYGMPVFENGRIFVTVGGDQFWGKREAWLKCIDAAKGAEIWSLALNRHSICTPAVSDGLVYVADIGRLLHCVEAETGRELWNHDLGGEVWSSPLVADGKVYVGTRKGDFWIFDAAREKRQRCSVRLDSPIAATACPANGRLFLSTMKRLYAFQAGK